MTEHLYIECQCGSPDHLITLWRDGDDVGVNVQMSHWLPWWRRIIVAVNYVIGQNPRCHWADALLTPADRARIAAFIAG